jgi:hypothetical protein
MCDANKVSMAQLQLRMDKEAEEKDAQIANLTQLTEQLQQDAVRLTRENAQLRQVNTQILDRVPAQARAQQQQEGATPQSQQQQQRLGQQPQARAQQRNKLVVVLGGAEDADDNAVLAGVTAAAGLAHDAVEKVVRSGPVWLLHLRDESAALRLLDSKQAVANLAETQQQQEPAVEGGEQAEGSQEEAPQQQQQQQQQRRRLGWWVRPDRSLAERQARREHSDVLYTLYCEGARPRVHSDGKIYVKTTDGIVPHTQWTVDKKLPDSFTTPLSARRRG